VNRESSLIQRPPAGRAKRAIGFFLLAFVMPFAFITCGQREDETRRAMFPSWRKGEWWEVVTTVAMVRPKWGAELSGLDLYHRFVVADEETLDGISCWRVEVLPFNIRKSLRKAYGGKILARLWVARDSFRPVRLEKRVGQGRNLVEPPYQDEVSDPAGKAPLLLPNALPTILDLPVGPLRADQKIPLASWEAADFHDATSGRLLRQTVHEVVEKRGHWRERVLKVSLSDGSVACHQVWTPGRPWPDSMRTWFGKQRDAPFVYESKVRSWSKRPYKAWIGVFFLAFGFCAQGMFTMRFVVQWIASERAGRSVIPMAFWYLSLAGGAMLLTYAIYRLDPVFILGQSFGVVIYTRNVWFRWRERRERSSASDTDHEVEDKD